MPRKLPRLGAPTVTRPLPEHRIRGTAAQRGYNSAWRKARAGYLARHPLCVQCLADGITTAATVVDHIRPHRGDQRLFWNRDNWQPLCKRHHDIKTATEDGGLGHNQSPAQGGG